MMVPMMDNCVGLPPKVVVPGGCIVVALREVDGPDGKQLAVVSDQESLTDRAILRVVQSPSDYRVVPRATADEYAALCRRHEAEIEQFWARLIAMPTFKVTVTLDTQ